MNFMRLSPIIILVSAWTLSPAWAASDHAFQWREMEKIDYETDLESELESEYNLYAQHISDTLLDEVSNDYEKRIDEKFRIHDGMRSVVEFWLKVYTRYSTQNVVLFDERHPEVIYEVLDFRDLQATAKTAILYEILRNNKVAKRIKEYRVAFSNLRKGKPARTRDEKIIVEAIKKSKHKHSIASYNDNLKTQTGQRDNIIRGIIAASPFVPRMEYLFSEVGVPKEIVWLSLVESSFNLKAISRVGASGVWQWMPRSAKEYMTLNNELDIDERISPLKSTVASARLLKRNLQLLQTWPLSITAYNYGVKKLVRVSKDPKRDQLDYVFSACKEKHKIGWAPRSYYASFLAVLYAQSYRDKVYGVKSLPIDSKPIAVKRLTKPIRAIDLALKEGVSISEFKRLNPDIRNIKVMLPTKFLVIVPASVEDISGLTHIRAKIRYTSNTPRILNRIIADN